LKVAFITCILPHYRIRFHEIVRELLASQGVEYNLVYSDPIGVELEKGDTVELSWATKVPARLIGHKGKGFIWQPIHKFFDSDLIIVGHENRQLASYVGIVGARFMRFKIAYFGHGKNFQAKTSNSLAERWKRFCAKRVDWWFTYTKGCGEILQEYGYPNQKITVFNNAIDLGTILKERLQIDLVELRQIKDELLDGSENVGVYVGGLYPEKRIAFLLKSSQEIRIKIPDFQLLIIGGGPDSNLALESSVKFPWIHYVGPKFGVEKSSLVSLAKVWLMPGLVGLGVLDSFAYGAPLVTTNIPYHSPEFEYLVDGTNGVVVSPADDVSAYADAVVKVLTNTQYRESLITGGKHSMSQFSIENMAENFATGVMTCLGKGVNRAL